MKDANGVELDRTPVKPGNYTYADPCPAGDYSPEQDEEKRRAREADTKDRKYYSGA